MKTLLAFLTLAVALAHGHHNDIDRTQDLKQVHDFPEYIIVNGYLAAEGSVPYIVSLKPFNGTHTGGCGGSIIGDNWILTAAHCLTNIISVEIFYGSNYNFKSHISHRVGKENFISHEQYNNFTNSFDIALIRTPSRIEFSAKISKIALPKFSDQADSMVGWNTKACGWGHMLFAVPSAYLQCVDLNIISNAECAKTFTVTDDMVCTGLADLRGTCNGDSGGPLVTRSNPPTLVGVVSFGKKFCFSDSVYARVPYFLKWIHEKTSIPIQN